MGTITIEKDRTIEKERRAGAKARHLLVPLLFAALLFCVPLQAQPGDLDAWLAIKTPDFTILTDADPQRGAEIALSLARFRAAFAQLAPEIELRSPAPTTILAFRDARAYAPYKSAADRGALRILGQFLSHPDGNYITLNADARMVGAFDVIYHEYVHYFVRHNFPGVPLWFNEGLAEYYSTFAIEGEHAWIGRPVARHLAWLRRHEVSLAAVLEASSQTAREHGAEEAGSLYAVSWALVHYLLSSPGHRLDQTADYLDRLEEGEEPARAFEAAFDTRLGSLEDGLRDYVLQEELATAKIPLTRLPGPESIAVHRARPAQVLYHLGDLLAHMKRGEAAERHFQLALDHDPEHPDVHAGLALVRDLSGRYEEAELLYRDALALGSTSALSHLLYGRHLLATVLGNPAAEGVTARAARAREVLAQAARLDPTFAEVEALYGYAHLFGDAEPTDGITHLERARARLPGRMDVVFHLVQLHLRGGEVATAEALVEDVLRRRAAPELLARGREEVQRWSLLRAADEALRAGEVEEGLRLFDEAITATSDAAARARMEEELLRLQARFTAP